MMRRVYLVLAALLMLAVVAQFYLAAVGAFDRPRTDDSFALHAMVGMLVPVIALLATGAAALARAPGRLIGFTVLPAGLAIVQALLAVLAKAFDNADDTTTTAGLIIFGLHGLNALAIMGTSGMVLRNARELAMAPAAKAVSQPVS
jgi:hypothetical protein